MWTSIRLRFTSMTIGARTNRFRRQTKQKKEPERKQCDHEEDDDYNSDSIRFIDPIARLKVLSNEANCVVIVRNFSFYIGFFISLTHTPDNADTMVRRAQRESTEALAANSLVHRNSVRLTAMNIAVVVATSNPDFPFAD